MTHTKKRHSHHPLLLRLVAVLPDDRWATTVEVADLARAAGMPVKYDDERGLMLGTFEFASAMRGLRRRGWAVHRVHDEPRAWRRTPSGTTIATPPAQPALAVAFSDATPQETHP